MTNPVASIDLNGDVGEWGSDTADAAARLRGDAEFAASLSSLNVACGGHAGDVTSMRALVRLARDRGLALGGHPSFPDRSGFGRLAMAIAPAEIERIVAAQVGDLVAIATHERMRVGHVKPHGALYNLAAADDRVADAIARAAARIDRRLVIVGLSGGALIDAARRHGLAAASEVFCDRGYEADGSLTPRTQPGSVLADPVFAATRLVRMVREGLVESRQGSTLRVIATTACIHGDTPHAADFARTVRAALEKAGIGVAHPA